MKDHRITYGLSSALKRLVSIDEVERGLKCNCICPDKHCNEPLVACKGKVRKYFRHNSKKDCIGGFESQWHFLSKEIICENKSIMLPKYVEDGVFFAPENIPLKTIQLEIHTQGRQPDLLCTFIDRNGVTQNLWIEILYTHAVDDIKVTEIQDAEINCLEIDVRSFQNREINKNELKEFLLTMPCLRQWINCEYRKKDVKIIKEVKEEILTGKMDILEFVKQYSDNTELKPLFGCAVFTLYQTKTERIDFYLKNDIRNKMYELIENHIDNISKLSKKGFERFVSLVQFLSFELIRWDKYDNREHKNKQIAYEQCVSREKFEKEPQLFAYQIIQLLPHN